MPNPCPQCRTENPRGAAKCAQCGAALPTSAAGTRESRAPRESRPIPEPRKPRGGLSRFALWAYRAAAVALLIGWGFTGVRLMLTERDLTRAQAQLANARILIERTVLGEESLLPKMRLVPPDGQPVIIDADMGDCRVEEILFHGDEVTLRIANNGTLATRPFVRVTLFDAYGREVGRGAVVDYRSASFQASDRRSVTARVRAAEGRARYFVLDGFR
ncbi:MAG: zinc ribbon domain-containing protein [Armatimonadetes bacterium]|nr:zinc ribbon domain-containing protein [Armatimonadota bacterium]